MVFNEEILTSRPGPQVPLPGNPGTSKIVNGLTVKQTTLQNNPKNFRLNIITKH